MTRSQESGRRRAATRRDFLKRSAVAASAAVSATQTARHAHAAGSDIIRVGMIGCGGRNTGAAAQALTADPGARLVAMCDIFMDRVRHASASGSMKSRSRSTTIMFRGLRRLRK